MTSECVHYAPLIGSRPGELSGEEERALAAHLGACGSCRAIASDLAALDGLVAEGLAREAAARDFSPFVDQVMARVERKPARSGVRGFLSRHRRAAAGVLVPVLAALALLVYVEIGGGPQESPFLELSSVGEVTTILQTADGPVVLLADEDSGS